VLGNEPEGHGKKNRALRGYLCLKLIENLTKVKDIMSKLKMKGHPTD
jgi:hypothetical protein